MSYHSKIDKLVETALGEMQPGLMAKVRVMNFFFIVEDAVGE